MATITATAGYRGQTKSRDFVVKVAPLPTELTLNGRSLGAAVPGTAFQPDVFSYDVILPDGMTTAPQVGVNAPSDAAVRVEQAAGVPGTTQVAVTGPEGDTRTYTVHFAHPAQTDEFTNGLAGDQWHWIRHNPDTINRTAGVLQINTEAGDILSTPTSTTNDARNLLVQPRARRLDDRDPGRRQRDPHAGLPADRVDRLPGRRQLPEVRAGGHVDERGSAPGRDLGGQPLVLRSRLRAGLGPGVGDARRGAGPGRVDEDDLAADDQAWRPLPDVVLGGRGSTFTPACETGAPLEDVNVGLFSAGPNTSVRARYDYFRVSGQLQPAAIPRPGEGGRRHPPR